MSVRWRKLQRTHLEIVSSHELFARRLPSSADTLHSVSTSRRCSSGALLQLQVQLTALAVLQLQRADTPEFVSASSGGLQRSLSEHGDSEIGLRYDTRHHVSSTLLQRRRLSRPHAARSWSSQSLKSYITANIPTLYSVPRSSAGQNWVSKLSRARGNPRKQSY